MVKLTFDYIENNGLLLYKFIRGSKCHGTDTELSDTDIGAIYICPTENILGTGFDYVEQVSNETNDIVYYEIGKFIKLLCNSNPTMLEMLFVEDEFVLYEHPIFKEFRKHRDLFVTKKCFNSFFSYSHSQIRKCCSSEKLFSNPTTEKKGPLDFCYTFLNQGSTKLINWLLNNGYKQKYCGLVSVPNMHNMYGVYYDWKADYEDYGYEHMNTQLYNWGILKGLDGTERLGYSGIVAEDGSSNTLRYIQDNYTEKDGVMLNSVAKGQEPICYMSFNADGYAKHLRDYTRYQKWLKERNPVRYENNKDYRYDAKNVSEAFRLTNMAIEIAQGKGVLVNRRNIDRDFLLNVKNHTYSYEELMEMLQEKEIEMKQAVETCTLPDEVNIERVNDLLINIRKQFYNNG